MSNSSRKIKDACLERSYSIHIDDWGAAVKLDFPASWCASHPFTTSVSLTREEAAKLSKDLGDILGKAE